MYVLQRNFRYFYDRRNCNGKGELGAKSGKDGTRIGIGEDRVLDEEETVRKYETKVGKEQSLGKYTCIGGGSDT